jgi:CRP-like cAMP-binding protein
MHERPYLTDEIVFDEGEEGQALYLVMSGWLISRGRDSAFAVVGRPTP